jgi:peptidoglycan hydrolase-like protein with peptidoglycan-binding domain
VGAAAGLALCAFSAGMAPAAGAAAHKTSLGKRTLRVGMRGTDVRALQQLLTRAGFKVDATAFFGVSTRRRVLRFQRAAGLKVTGVVAPADARSLRRFLGSAALGPGGFDYDHRGLGSRVLRAGMTGSDVRKLQDLLWRAGFATRVNGKFDKDTVQAVSEFEVRAVRPQDGIVDRDDIVALRKVVAGAPAPLAPGDRAKVGPDGLAIAPAAAPPVVQAVIAAGNQIASKPYKWGGGHGKWDDTGYDCSGSVGYALHGAALLDVSMTSGELSHWGAPGAGQWITIYANAGHVYMVVAGLRFDTSGATKAHSRWQTAQRSPRGYRIRHPEGL